MGHVVFAAPPIAGFHLHERLRRELLRRGHRVSVLCAHRHEFTFWREQLADVDLLAPLRGPAAPLPDEVLERADGARDRRAARRLVGAAQRWLEREQPDLLLFHQRRSAVTSTLQFVARSVGAGVLWTGSGLLPHTLQLDARGLDGDAGVLRLQAKDYRVVRPDRPLLDASLAHALSCSQPAALPRARVAAPPAGRRVADALHGLLRGDGGGIAAAWSGWTAAVGAPGAVPAPPPPPLDLAPPFVAVLLQRADDARVRWDAPDTPADATLVQRAIDVADALGARAPVVALLPAGVAPTSALRTRLAGARHERVQLAPASAAATVAATAAVTLTINHPLAFVALLAGTPVVHLGRALYELDGVAVRGAPTTLERDVGRAMRRDRAALRRRLLTWQLRHGHVWCCPEQPNHNGVLGLAEAVERALGAPAGTSPAMAYRVGPTWPLAAT